MPARHKTLMTRGEARRWARRLRKLGFSPVTMHRADPDDPSPRGDGFYLRCSWPNDAASLPEDVCQYLRVNDDGDVYCDYTVDSRSGVKYLLAMYAPVRLGMGSRPIPIARPSDPVCPTVGAMRIVYDSDDWPPEVLALNYAQYLQELGELDEEHTPFCLGPRFNHPIAIAPSGKTSAG